ncbi:endonuclease MutS2 [Bacteroidia bacterium]|nr:endonuclease MutS2 [Bacteroidia bacterium]
MFYPANFKEKIGFTAVESTLNSYCLSPLGQQHVANIAFITDFDTLEGLLSETEEMRILMESGASVPSQDYYNLIPCLERISIAGSIIELEEMLDLRASLNTIGNFLVLIYGLDEQRFPYLTKRIDDIYVAADILERLFALLDDEGQLADSASPELFRLRRLLRSKRSENEHAINRILRKAKEQGWVHDNAEATVRNGRLVLPVQSGFKSQMPGLIHDISSTGQTLFIEPHDVSVINNEIQNLENDERIEIYRILKEFTDFLRPYNIDLLRAYEFLGYMDFLRAKALLALHYRCIKPIMNADPFIEWFAARHPVLEQSLKKQGKTIVPMDIRLDTDVHILIISGPNAGGKSVCLKTVGLVQFMFQCGLLAPMDEQSEMGLFDFLFIDIGDQQSLENDLSTYSSHLSNMRYLLEHSHEKTLFLSDELGSGTEPQIGGAIAEAMLEYLHAQHSVGIVTTHYANLKLLSDRLSGIENGAMLFDMDCHKPLYILQTGHPGSSFALETAKNIGLPDAILQSAMQKTGIKHVAFEQQLQQLELEKHRLEQQQQSVQVADEFLASTIAKYEQLHSRLEVQKKELLTKAKTEAKQIIEDANKLVERTIADIKSVGAEKTATKTIRHTLVQQREQLASGGASHKPEAYPHLSKINPTTLKVGDLVKLSDTSPTMEVASIRGKQAELIRGSIRIKVPIEQLFSV